MYELPSNFDLHLLKNCYLEMICFGPCVTKLDFSRPLDGPGATAYKVSFCVEGNLSYRSEGISWTRDFSDVSSCAPLLKFLLQEVKSVVRIGSSTLELSFKEGDAIVIEADCDADFESYSIYLNSGEIVVV